MPANRMLHVAGLLGLWLVTALEALSMADAGLGKFEHAAGWRHWFQVWGYPAGFVTLVGLLEFGGAVLLVIPFTAPFAAALLTVIMAAAEFTVLTNPTDLSWVDPLIHVLLLVVIGWARRPGWVGGTAWRRPLRQPESAGG